MKQWPSVLVLGAVLLSGCIRITSDKYESEGPGNEWNSEGKALARREKGGIISSSVQRVFIDNSGGWVKVAGVDDGFEWKSQLKCYARDEAMANDFVDQCTIEGEENNGSFRLVLTIPRGNQTPRLESQMELRVPKSVAVEVRNRFGEVEILEVSGSVQTRNQSGHIHLKSLPGKITASTSFGELMAEQIGPASLQNQSGAIQVSEVAGDLQASTSFGRLAVRDVRGTVELNNQSGEISASHIKGEITAHTSFSSLHIEDTGPAHLSNQSGNIEAMQVGGDLTAKTSFSRLLARHIQGKAELVNQSGEIIASHIQGDLQARTSFSSMQLSGNSPAVKARNQSGSIEIIAPQAHLIDAETSFSSIQVRLPSEVKPLILAETRFGNIKSDFPVLVKNTMSESQIEADSSVPKITLKTHNGDIRIVKAMESRGTP